MSFPRYPSYKDSGVEWLGQVPEHWGKSKLRYACKCLDGQRVPLNAAERSDRPGEIPYWGANSIQGYVDEALLDEDLVLLGEDGAPFFEPSKPVAFFSQGKVWPNNHVHVLRPTVAGTGRFITHVLNVADYAQFIDGSTRDKLTQGSMNDIPVPWPPLAEQSAIVEFLDRETGKIDELVAEQRRLMELLKEKRQAVISHAVTRGLNPAAPLKPSGIEWLGEVPEHWEVGKLSRLISTRKGIAFKAEDFTDEGVPVVKASDIKGLSIRRSETCLPESFLEQYPKARLKTGDLVLSTVGSSPEVRNSAVGQLGMVPEALSESLLNQNTVVFTPSSMTLINDFLCLILQTVGYRDHLDLHAHGTANQASINVSDMLDFFVPLPGLAEQEEIARFISEELGKFDTLTAEAQRAIDLLQERRTALISAAVTGQIDVRGGV